MARLAPATSTKIKQFNLIVHLGGTYLQPTSRVLPVLLVSLTYLSYHHIDPVLQARWKHCLAAILCLVPIDPWERNLIFPTNDKLAAMGEDLAKMKKEKFGDERDAEVDVLFTKWCRWHVGRIVSPMVATAILAGSTAGVLPF